jgi:hypothetical protein
MKNLFFFTLVGLLGCMFSCTDNVEMDTDDNQITTRAKPTKITICHYNKGNDTYKTRTINDNQLDKHLEHGDFLGACDDAVVCDPVCIFCNYIYLMDFDEPCPDNPFDGDVYCSTFVSADCLENPEAGTGQTYLWDRDLYRNLSPFCGSDDENDSGIIQVDWEIGCNGSFFGQVYLFYDDGVEGTPDIVIEDLGATEANYNKALFCKGIIDDLAADLGYSNACSD